MPSINITVFNEKTKNSIAVSINTSNTLEQVVTKLCVESFSLPNQMDGLPIGQAYSLRCEDDSLMTEEYLKKKLEVNATLKLTASPAIESKEAIEKLKSSDVAAIKLTMFALQKRLRERDYVNEFVAKEGFLAVKKVILEASGNTLAYALVALNNLMEMDSGWDTFEDKFIEHLVHTLVNESLFTISKPVTSIIIKIANADEKSTGAVRCYGFDVLNRAITACGSANVISTLIQRLSASDHLVQVSSLTLLNSLFKNSLHSSNKEQFARLLYQNGTREIIISLMAKVGQQEEVDKTLLEFQRHVIFEYFLRKSTNVSWEEKRVVNLLNDVLQVFGFPRSMVLRKKEEASVIIDPSSSVQSPSPSKLSFAPLKATSEVGLSEGNIFAATSEESPLGSVNDLDTSDKLKRATKKRAKKKSSSTRSALQEETTLELKESQNLTESLQNVNDDDDVFVEDLEDTKNEKDQDIRFWRRLGFKTEDPVKDATRVGVLGLQLLIDILIKKDILEQFKVLPIDLNLDNPDENWSMRPPVCRASFEITEMLCDHWDISTGVMTKTSFQPHILSFEQVQTSLLQTFLRLWGEDLSDEKKLGLSDPEYNAHFLKILAITRSHMKTCLKQETIPLEALIPIIVNEKYSNIKSRYIKDIEEEDQLVNHHMVRNLRKKLYTDTYDFIKDQRISCLLAGAWFQSPILNKQKKNQARFFKLSSNRKFIHWGEYPEARDSNLNVEDLPNKSTLL
eukprot:NODE_21_length_42443_cov_0.822808.p5 type:complete len:737 gc:universal NODE_21_length_42443_cov_0.822808:29075-26865(-)